MRNQINNFLRKYKSLLIVSSFMLIAISIRLKFHFSGNYLLAGVDGPYYPLQARSILEKFHLGLSDMPLLFMIEALIAKFLQIIHVGTLNECIIVAVKFVDVILPPLAAIPVYLFAREINVNKGKMNFLNYFMVGYSILNVTPILLFSNNFQKNAVCVVFIFFYLYFLLRIFKYFRKSDFIYAFITLTACTLTHFGSTAIIFLITGIILVIYFMNNRPRIYSMSFKKILFLVIPIILFFSILFFFDSNRLERFINLPLKLFESPVILVILDGQNIGEYFNPINFFVPNILAVLGIILFIQIKNKLNKENQILGLGLLLSAIALSSPLIGIDWANRLYMMSYVPLVGAYLILFNNMTKKWTYFAPIALFSTTMSFAILRGYLSPMLQSITNEAYQELKEIKNEVILNENSVIVARQDLKILASWEFGTLGIASYLLRENDFSKFESIYYLNQINGINYTQEEAWREMKLPINSINVFHGKYFDLFRVDSYDQSMSMVENRSKIKGEVIQLLPDGFIVQSIVGKKRTVVITENTRCHFSTLNNKIKIGMEVEVWGEGVPFSLKLNAQTIVE